MAYSDRQALSLLDRFSDFVSTMTMLVAMTCVAFVCIVVLLAFYCLALLVWTRLTQTFFPLTRRLFDDVFDINICR